MVEIAASCGVDMAAFTREAPGMSAFALEDGVVYHTYSTYARGLDGLWGMYQWLDRAPLGRNEEGIWWRRHDEYAAGDRSRRQPRRLSAMLTGGHASYREQRGPP